MKHNSIVQELQTAHEHHYAIGAFNILNDLSARAVVAAAEELDTPVILQTSVSTVKAYGPEVLGTMLRAIRDEASVNVIIHLDHCRDISLAKACIDAGWDSVMFDGSALPLEENIRCCREVVDYAHAHGVCVEGELGRIGGVEDNIKVSSDEVQGAGFEDSVRFVRESGIDTFAPAIGTAHGIYKSSPKIRFDFVDELSHAMDTPIVVHGGSGLPEDTFRRLISDGAAKVNISTNIKHAYLDSAREYFEKNPDKLDPLGFDRAVSDSVKAAALEHMKIFREDAA